MIKDLAIAYDNNTLHPLATELSHSLSLPINNQAKAQLRLSIDKLELIIPPFLPMSADFNWQSWEHRRAAGKKQALVRACKPKPGLKILDTTAGWGRDAAVLASFGAEVLMLERDSLMAALLQDALRRQDELSQAKMKLSLLHQDALAYLDSLAEADYPDVIYIDPMHPLRQKSALVKKDLQILQQWIGPDSDPLALLGMARRRVKQRVVVKWPQKLPPLMEDGLAVEGKTVRFDVYVRDLRQSEPRP